MIDDPRSHPHLSAALLATGEARFVRDEPRPRDLLFASPVPGPVPHGRLLGVDAREALARPGVVRVVTAADIPGENQLGEVADDEPLLAAGTVDYAGQPVALVLAESGRAARDAARLVRIGCEELEPVLTIEEALARDMLYAPERRIERGEVEAGFAAADLVLEGVIRTPAQEHLYLETQSSRALPAEGGGIILYCATQSPADVQQLAARTLGIAHKDVTVEVRRVGGGFGGKETNATRWACLAALGCRLTGRPVELTLTRAEDIAWTGKRHPFETRYKAGFSAAGRLLAYAVDFSINGGASTDLSMAVLERAMLHADNAYYVPHVRIVGRACRTNLPPNTAMRGFGAPQGIFAVESVMELAARRLGIDPARLRRLNAYADGQETPCGQPVPDARTPELLDRLLAAAGYDRLRGAVDEYNRTHPHHRRGIGVVPVKFGISFTASFKNQGSALVWAFRDGTVSV
ncbi:hypothetical protein FJY71_02815, partial [candidate division WOR-3 bacterium]|nr:hypothetical protein [candidate division WOR-3 bacterium]